MDDLFAAALAIQATCVRRGFGHCIIGGVAVLRWGAPRVTRDVDIAVLADFGRERVVVDGLLDEFAGRIPDAAAFAVRNRVLLLKTAVGVEIDVSLAALDFERAMIDQATEFEPLPGVRLRTCGAEDLVVMKAFANRPRDWDAVESIARCQPALDWPRVFTDLTPLADVKGDPSILERLAAVKRNLQ